MSNLHDIIERIIQRLTEGSLDARKGSLAYQATEQIMDVLYPNGYPTNEVMMLMAHKQLGFAPKCYCGWSAPISLNDTESDRRQWAEHVAYMLVWGVNMPSLGNTERTRIDPADIRVGDRVERVYVSGDHETIERFTVEFVAHRAVGSCRLSWDIGLTRPGDVEWYLLDRPDPDANLIERVAEAICNDDHSQETGFGWAVVGVDTKDTYHGNARAALAAIRETHDITPKGGER